MLSSVVLATSHFDLAPAISRAGRSLAGTSKIFALITIRTRSTCLRGRLLASSWRLFTELLSLVDTVFGIPISKIEAVFFLISTTLQVLLHVAEIFHKWSSRPFGVLGSLRGKRGSGYENRIECDEHQLPSGFAVIILFASLHRCSKSSVICPFHL